MRKKDRYASYGGTLYDVTDYNHAIILVSQKRNCRVWFEGSTGSERTIWTDLADGVWGDVPSKKVVLAHVWETKNGWKLRIFERPME